MSDKPTGRPRADAFRVPPRPGGVGAPPPVHTPPPGAPGAAGPAATGGPAGWQRATPAGGDVRASAAKHRAGLDESPAHSDAGSEDEGPIHPITGRFDVPNAELYKDAKNGFMVFKSPANDQGWKLHAPAPASYRLDGPYKSAIKLLQAREIPHKFVRDRSYMKDHMNKPDGTQGGKFLTVYPNDEAEMMLVVAALDGAMRADAFEDAPKPTSGDKLVGGKQLVGARYGGLTSPCVTDPSKVSEVSTVDDLMRDNRRKYKPDAVRDPFDPKSTGVDGWGSYGVTVSAASSGDISVTSTTGDALGTKNWGKMSEIS